MGEFSVFNRYDHESEDIAKKDALDILSIADLHTGPYGGMGGKIDLVVYEYDEENDDYNLLAVRYEGNWLSIPCGQEVYMQFELDHTNYEE